MRAAPAKQAQPSAPARESWLYVWVRLRTWFGLQRLFGGPSVAGAGLDAPPAAGRRLPASLARGFPATSTPVRRLAENWPRRQPGRLENSVDK